MRRIYQSTSLLSLGVGLYLVFQGRALGLAGQFGPGPGFFAFWVGVTLTMVSIIWGCQVSLQPVEPRPADFIPERGGILRVSLVVIALVAFNFLLDPLGFNLAMFGLLVFLLFAFGREYPILKIVISIAGSFGVHYVFEKLLLVPLPYSPVAFLRNLGF